MVMNETYEIRNRIGAKVAFLGLFVAAVLSAQLVVAMRSRVVLSEPIQLAHAGLSVSMPEGNGWRSAKRWEYQQNGFTIGSTYVAGPSRPTGAARCRYLSPAETTVPQIRFEQEERALEGKIVQTGRIDAHTDPAIPATVTVDWVHIQKPGAWFNTFFGTAKLPHNARLEIEVHESTGDADLAEHVLRRIAESVRITDSPLLDAGAQIIAEMKDKGIVGFLDNQNRQSLFLVMDDGKNILGFTSDVLVDTGPGSELIIQAASLYYLTGLFVHEEVTSFQSDNRFDRFVWRFDRFAWKSAGIAPEREGAAISLDEAGILTVTTFGEEPKESSYYIGASAVPAVLIEQLLAQLLDSDKKDRCGYNRGGRAGRAHAHYPNRTRRGCRQGVRRPHGLLAGLARSRCRARGEADASGWARLLSIGVSKRAQGHIEKPAATGRGLLVREHRPGGCSKAVSRAGRVYTARR